MFCRFQLTKPRGCGGKEQRYTLDTSSPLPADQPLRVPSPAAAAAPGFKSSTGVSRECSSPSGLYTGQGVGCSWRRSEQTAAWIPGPSPGSTCRRPSQGLPAAQVVGPAFGISKTALKDPVQQACWGEVVQKRQGGDTAELIDKITCFSCAGGGGLRQPGGALTPCGRSARDSRREWPCYLLSDVLPICCSAITPLHADDVSI